MDAGTKEPTSISWQPAAASAAIQRQYKARAVGCAAAKPCAQAEPPVIAEDTPAGAIHEIHDRIEDQAAITEDPDVGCIGVIRDHGPPRGKKLFLTGELCFGIIPFGHQPCQRSG